LWSVNEPSISNKGKRLWSAYEKLKIKTQ